MTKMIANLNFLPSKICLKEYIQNKNLFRTIELELIINRNKLKEQRPVGTLFRGRGIGIKES